MNKSLENQSIHILYCVLQDANICIDLQYIDKILPLLLLEAVPNSPAYLIGLMNLAGKTIPVIDLRLRFGMCRDKSYSVDTPILLCSFNGSTAGLIVDKITGIAEVEKGSLQMHKEFEEPNSPFMGTFTIKENASLLIDMSYIFPIFIKNEMNKAKGSTAKTKKDKAEGKNIKNG